MADATCTDETAAVDGAKAKLSLEDKEEAHDKATPARAATHPPENSKETPAWADVTVTLANLKQQKEPAPVSPPTAESPAVEEPTVPPPAVAKPAAAPSPPNEGSEVLDPANFINTNYDAAREPEKKLEEEILKAREQKEALEKGQPPPLNNKFARLGGPVPPLSEASKIPFLTEGNPNRLQSAFVHCLPDDVPPELRDIQSHNWKDGKLLIKTFLVLNTETGRRTKSKIQIPHCLLLSAKTLHDRLTVVNFWLSSPKDEQLKMLRNREEGLLKYYMQLKDTRENTFRQAYISGNPVQQLQKKRAKQLAALVVPPVKPPKDVEEEREITVDEHSTCLDYVLRRPLLCVPCDQFRHRFLPPHHRNDYDKWPLYKERRKQICADPAHKGAYKCTQLFYQQEVGRGVGHRKKRIMDFIYEKRIVTKTPSLVEWERKKNAKPCFGLSGEGVRQLILQSAEQANRQAILNDQIIPDSFGLAECYHNRTGFDNVIISKEERLIKVYSRNRVRNNKKTDSSKDAEGEGDSEVDKDKSNTTTAVVNGENGSPQAAAAALVAAAGAGTAENTSKKKTKDYYHANQREAGLSKYHYVIRSKDCTKEVDTERGHKLCKACTDAAVMVRSVARDAAKPLNLSKGAALTKLDVAKLITNPELIDTTIRGIRQLRAKDMKMARKELARLRDRAGFSKQPRKNNALTNAAVAEQLQHVEHHMQAQQQQQQQLAMAGMRRYEVGDHEESHHHPIHPHEVYYDSDDPAMPRATQRGQHARVLPRGPASPSKRARTHY